MINKKARTLLRSFIDYAIHTYTWIRNKRWLMWVANAFMVIGMIFFLSHYALSQWDQLKQINLQINWFSLIGALCILGLNTALFSTAWHFVMNLFDGGHFSVIENVLIYNATQIPKLLPTQLWFYAGRIVYYSRKGLKKRAIIVATFVEAILQIWIGVVIIAGLFIQKDSFLTWLFLPLWLGISAIIAMLGLPYIRQVKFITLDQFFLGKIAKALFLYFLTWILSLPFLMMIMTSLGLNSSISGVELTKIWIVSSLFAYIGSYLLGGVGVVREFSLTFLLTNYFAPPIALAIAILSRLLIIAGTIVWSGVFVGIMNLSLQRDPKSKI